MNIIDFLPADSMRRAATGADGPEFAGPCPSCGGEDRFRVWVEHSSGAIGGRYYCRGCNATGDGIQFLRDFQGMSFAEAKAALGVGPGEGNFSLPGKKGSQNADKPSVVTPVPEGVPDPNFNHHRLGQPTAVFTYRDTEGALLGYVCRFNKPEIGATGKPQKEFCPLVWTTQGWRWQALPSPRPLYGLDRLRQAAPDAPVLAVEGEGKADAACGILGPEIVVLSLNGGSSGANNNDYSPLRGRRVAYWRDADAAGLKAAETFRKKALEAGAAAVLIVRPPEGAPQGWDIADAIKEGWDCERLRSYVRNNSADGADAPDDEHDSEQQEPPKLDARRFTLTRLDQIETKPPEWLVHELLTVNSLAVVFADPEAGKSFLAVDLAASVATGETFFHQDTRQSAVVYINGEGQDGIKRRFDAWEIKRQTSLKGAPIFLSNITTDLTDPDSVTAVELAVDEIVADYGNPGLIVIDTLNRNFGPADENSTADMTRFVQGLDQLRMKYQAALLVVHHTGHANKERGRGSMVLHGGVDSEYCLTKNGDLIQMKCSKMKDFSRPLPMTFKLETVELPMIDEYGLQVTSAVLELTDYEPRPKPTRAGKGKNQVKALDVLRELIERHQASLESAGHDPAGARVTVDDWREKCKARGVNKDRFWEIKKSLEEQCFVSIENGFAVIANGATEPTEMTEMTEMHPKQSHFGRQDEGDRNDRNAPEMTAFRSRTPTEMTENPYRRGFGSVTSSSVGPDKVEM